MRSIARLVIPASLRSRRRRSSAAEVRAPKSSRRSIDVTLADGVLAVEGHYVRGGWRVGEVLAVLRTSGRSVRVPATGDRRFSAELSVDELIATASDDDTIADLWAHLAPREGRALETDEVPPPIRLGRFERTTRRDAAEESGADEARLIVTDKGNLSIALPGSATGRFRTEHRRVAVDRTGVRLEVDLSSGDRRASAVHLVAVARETGARYRFGCDVVDVDGRSIAAHGRRVQQATLSLAWADLAAVVRPGEDTLDLYVEVEADRHAQERRIGARTIATRLVPASARGKYGVVQFVPYETFRGANLSLHVERMDSETLRALRRWTRLAWLLPLVRPFLGVWLIGELPYKAQDNGYHFFRWIRENRPRRRAYYVIEEGAPDLARVAPYGHVVLRHSKEHIRLAFLASRLVSTHHAEFLLPSRSPAVVRGIRGVRVFLQHGVMGTKNMVANYGRRAPGFATDRFHVSSEREREMIVNDFEFRPDQVRVTGLSRTDALLAPAEHEPTGVLVIPTWREWLGTPQAFDGSQYREEWLSFLQQPRLKKAIDEGLPVTFILHPNMRRFVDAFDVPGVRVVKQGEVDVQTLLREHACLVTDYSSVAFDFAFQMRPVLYFQFDRSRFIGARGSHLDLEGDLPGTILHRAEDVAAELEGLAESGFVMSPEHRRRTSVLLTHRDRLNNERVEASVRTAGGLRVHWWRLLDSAPARKAYTDFRQGKHYLRVMGRLMAFARLLPRKRTVVFESGSGRQYADSPRAIYEELSRRDTGLRTIWSTTSTFRPVDLATRKVQPRSPRYYWELGRASAWVNNQNFPIDVEPSRRTFYLQTWHGTPLKRMQHDAVSTTGRTEGYLERVSRMTGYWDALLSPSPFASACFRSAFRYEGPIIEQGYPRNDVMVAAHRDEVAATVRSRIGLAPGQRLVLFAPTFRDDAKVGTKFVFRPHVDLEELARHLPADTVLGIRKHGVIRESVEIPEAAQDRVIDVSDYPDVQDLLVAADVLVTDYSSLMFDYALTRRPILFYCYDIETYRDDLRGFYLDLEAEAPGPVLRTQDELFAALSCLDETAVRYADRRESFASTYGPQDDGSATARVVDELLRRTQ